ncbi:hypothetical protein CJ030_MR0G006217 [Morella rubra]|uniref:Myb/SANT-like domain-containing protein n=1 Tax=Morella rubra TaxID=262757 RepID=A0A6A1ULI8_9ROSI|nr:hypothetical protein CJ030_MR0G006217 [Morella rubra]
MRTRASAIHMLAELSNTEFTPARKSITSVATGPLTRSRQRYYLRERLPECQRYYLHKRLPKLRRRLPGIPKLKMDQEEHLWTATSGRLLLNILQDCIGNGTIVSGRFDSKAQITVMELINRCVERPFTAKQIKGKWDRLKRAYNDFAFILKQTGFGWDDDRHTVVASEEAWNVQYNMGHVHVDLEQDPPVITQMGSPPTQATLSPQTVHGKRVVDGSGTSQNRRKREKIEAEMSDCVRAMTNFCKVHSATSGSHVGNMSENSGMSQPPRTITKCIRWLSELSPPLPELQYHAAIDRLLDNKERQLAFLEMPPERRLEWLYRI